MTGRAEIPQYQPWNQTPDGQRFIQQQQLMALMQSMQGQQQQQPKGSPAQGLGSLIGSGYLGGQAGAASTQPDKLSTGSQLIRSLFGSGGGQSGGSATQAAIPEAFSGSAPFTPYSPVMTEAAAPEAASSLSAVAAPAALALIAAYTGKKGLEGFDAGRGKGAVGGFKAGLKSAGPLKFVPVLGQAPAIGGALGGIFGHKSTKEVQAERWKGLASEAGSPTTKAYAENYQNYLGSDQAKQDAAAAKTRDRTANPWTPEEVWGGAGMFQTFKDDWLGKYSENQRREISKRLLAENLIKSDHGDQLITNQDRARQIAGEVFGGATNSPQMPPLNPATMDKGGNINNWGAPGDSLDPNGKLPSVVNTLMRPPLSNRSSTRSPGIDNNGKRIVYNIPRRH